MSRVWLQRVWLTSAATVETVKEGDFEFEVAFFIWVA